MSIVLYIETDRHVDCIHKLYTNIQLFENSTLSRHFLAGAQFYRFLDGIRLLLHTWQTKAITRGIQ
jgi:hypothetical protein